MPLQGFGFDAVPRAPHLGDQPLLEALRLAIPDEAIAAGAHAGRHPDVADRAQRRPQCEPKRRQFHGVRGE